MGNIKWQIIAYPFMFVKLRNLNNKVARLSISYNFEPLMSIQRIDLVLATMEYKPPSHWAMGSQEKTTLIISVFGFFIFPIKMLSWLIITALLWSETHDSSFLQKIGKWEREDPPPHHLGPSPLMASPPPPHSESWCLVGWSNRDPSKINVPCLSF